jgi:hypothetical protein
MQLQVINGTHSKKTDTRRKSPSSAVSRRICSSHGRIPIVKLKPLQPVYQVFLELVIGAVTT